MTTPVVAPQLSSKGTDMTTTSITIDLGYDSDETAPLLPVRAALGLAFGAIVADLATSDADKIAAIDDALGQFSAEDSDTYETALENVDTALTLSRLNEWSCTAFSDDEEDGDAVFAGPYLQTLDEKVSHEAGSLAGAVLARDFGLVTSADFATITGLWIAVGLQLPDARPGATFADNVQIADERAKQLGKSTLSVPGWPLAAVQQ